jgi:acetoin utilization deacetylase AcuC-like enzyme
LPKSQIRGHVRHADFIYYAFGLSRTRYGIWPSGTSRPPPLRAIDKALSLEAFSDLRREGPLLADDEAIQRVHAHSYVESIRNAAPSEGTVYLDGDTLMCPCTLRAALLAAGSGMRAVDAVMSGEATNAFCGVRPPGHHAEPRHAMGFCFFNNVAIAAQYARARYGVERAAVVDFDVHHGNGTQAAFWSDKNLFFASTHQMPLYPGTGHASETGIADNIVNAPLQPGDDGDAFREALTNRILPALTKFSPDIIFISAGFDAHKDDPLADIGLVEADYVWATNRILDIANKFAGGRVISMLEGGYDLRSLMLSVAAHVKALIVAAS